MNIVISTCVGHLMIKTFTIFLCPPIMDPPVSCAHFFLHLFCVSLKLDCLLSSIWYSREILMSFWWIYISMSLYLNFTNFCVMLLCSNFACYILVLVCVAFIQFVVLHTNKTFQNMLHWGHRKNVVILYFCKDVLFQYRPLLHRNYDTCNHQILLVLIRYLILEEGHLCVVWKVRDPRLDLGEVHVFFFVPQSE